MLNTYGIYTIAERPELEQPADALSFLAWPAFMLEDPVAGRYWWQLFTRFADLQFVVCDENDTPIAAGNTIPLFWSGAIETLPGGWDAALELAMDQNDRGLAPNTLAALSATIHPDYQGRGLSPMILKTMRRLGQERGFGWLIAPVRPSLKSRYPLTPIERYITWTQPDGAPFDPWLRVHWRLGASVLALAPESMVIPGTIEQWENWAGMRFPESGRYVVPGALEPVLVSREEDRVIYVEPNVWMRHSLVSFDT